VSGLYAIVDTARDPKLHSLVVASPPYACLFAGDIPDPLDKASPYLVGFSDPSPLKQAWREEGWGSAWGMICRSSLPLDDLRRHLRKFLLAQLPDGDTVFFRFYDPRVWRVYWPTCTAEEQAKWLAGVEEFIGEASLGPAPRAPSAEETEAGLIVALQAGLDIVVGGRPKGHVEIEPGAPLEVGRLGAGVRVDDQLLSRRHFMLEIAGNELFLEDLGSANGTELNGELIEARIALADGDRIEAGKSAFHVHIATMKRWRIGETAWITAGPPEGWRLVPSFGFEREEEGRETVACTEERLSAGETLPGVISGRVRALQDLLPNFSAGRLDLDRLPGLAGWLSYRFGGGPMCQYQYFLEAGDRIGAVAWTRPGLPSPDHVPGFESLVARLSFEPDGNHP
jgi:pSer/pThr/pTyr-binding forkhead associated (FHA) protein